MAYARKVDANHAEIVDAFRKCGCSVLDLSRVGKGVPDLLIARGGRTWLVEVKAPGGDLTGDQPKFHATWQGRIDIARSVDDVLAMMAGRG